MDNNQYQKENSFHIRNLINKIIEQDSDNKQTVIKSDKYIMSGFSSIDELTGGWRKGQLITIMGWPSMGKTSLLLSMIKNLSINPNEKIAVGFFSLATKTSQLIKSILANVCEIPIRRLQKGNNLLESYELDILNKGIDLLYESPIYIDYKQNNINDICKVAKELVINQNIKILFIDDIHKLIQETSFKKKKQEYNHIMKCLKNLANDIDIPIIISSLFEKYKECNLIFEDLRNQQFNFFLETDTLIFLYRPDFYGGTEDEKGNSLIGINKLYLIRNKFGKTGIINLRFKDEYLEFANCNFENVPEKYRRKINYSDLLKELKEALLSEYDYDQNSRFEKFWDNGFSFDSYITNSENLTNDEFIAYYQNMLEGYDYFKAICLPNTNAILMEYTDRLEGEKIYSVFVISEDKKKIIHAYPENILLTELSTHNKFRIKISKNTDETNKNQIKWCKEFEADWYLS